LAENVGNLFNGKNNNSVTGVLGSKEFNLGYGESSVLSFVGNNKSLLDGPKWIDGESSVSSTTKLLSTIHPVVPNLENIVETNADKIYTLASGDQNSVTIPINIYFKMNALDNTQTGQNYKYVVLNNSTETTKHIKKVKFLLENEAENRPFKFTLKFTLNRNKVIASKSYNIPDPYIINNNAQTN
jgi:hypothetical protein